MSQTPEKLEKQYVCLLTYEECLPQGFEVGPFDLNFDMDLHFIYAQWVNHFLNETKESVYPYVLGSQNVLATFLKDFFADSKNRVGATIDLLHSQFITKEYFDTMIRQINAEEKLKFEKCQEQYKDHELIRYLDQVHLSPIPVNLNPDNWKAHCPSGRRHPIMIVPSTNEWGCGYCNRKGGMSELIEFYQLMNPPKEVGH